MFGVYELDIPGQVPTQQILLVFNQATHSVACESDETAAPDAQASSVTLPPTDRGQGAEPAQARSTAVILLVAGIALLAAASIVGRRRPVGR